MNTIIYLMLAILIFFILLIFVFPKLLYFSVLLYHAFKKDKIKVKSKSYKLKDLKEIR